MAADTLSFNQLSTVLAEITSQATGKTVIAPVNSNEFVTVAQTALLTGYDPLLQSISQVLSRTIFSIRPYYRKFGGLMVDNIRYGNHVRKLQSIDKPFEDDQRFKLVEGQAVDQYKVNKPEVLQTNFYGSEVFQKSITIFRDQLDNAFHSAEEFGRFIAMVMQNVSDMIEQAHESVARMTVGNFVAGKIVGDPKSVIHLVTEYNAAAGTTLTSTTAMQPDNFVPFIKWSFSRIYTASAMLEERTILNHINVTGKEVARHTPRRMQRMYLAAPFMNQIDATVLSTVFHDQYLRVGDYERVGFWQDPTKPTSLNIMPVYMNETGALVSPDTAVEQDNVFGVIMDEEAAGITVVNEWSASSPFNAAGGYTNIFWHFTDRYWNDFTENGIVFLMD